MFLKIDELKTVATREVIDLITNGDNSIVEEIIAESIDLMKSYLFKYYDTTAIFEKEDNDRSKVILKYLKDIVIHEIYIRRTKNMNEVAKTRYDEAMLWLEKIARGTIEADLPKKMVDIDGDGVPDEPSPFMKLGSRKTYRNHW
ncbi:phage protein Gp36 family protein [Riemerella anatipestifer]|uniref:phage protein Gp36 family protein n=1 Tax=Riemerella anatipestifer TaxID=34085 RepID=UPI0030C4ABC7